MIHVGIVGATGYTALELLILLGRHPHARVTAVTSRDPESPALAEVHPSLRGRFDDLRLQPLDIPTFCDAVDVAFCCLPHAASAEIVSQLLDAGLNVVDFSADYRLNDVATFEQWYRVEHPDPQRVGHVAYGIPELFREQIRDAKLVANPGCFPSSALLPLVPLIRRGMIDTGSIVIDSKTGVSGAGRKADLRFHFPECNESTVAYGVGTHRHMPEIDQIIQRATGEEVEVLFTPHLTPMDRGILSSIYVTPVGDVRAADVLQAWKEDYADEYFIRLTSQPPTTKQVAFTNFCDLFAVDARGRIVILSALDNLIKGASGAAVQNFNLMVGVAEATAL